MISVIDEDKKARHTSLQHNYSIRNSLEKSVTDVFKSIVNCKKNRSNRPPNKNISHSEKESIYQNEKVVVFRMRVKVLIQNDPKQP